MNRVGVEAMEEGRGVICQDSLTVLQDSVERVKQAFISRGSNGYRGCLEGCIGLVYSLVENNQADLFRYLFLIHGRTFLGEVIEGRFKDHYMVVGGDQQGIWFAVSPANFDLQPQPRILQAANPGGLSQQIRSQVGGSWIYLGNISSDLDYGRYQPPEVIHNDGRIKLRTTVGEWWDVENSGYCIATRSVKLFAR